jgi:hypothetical protein
MNLRDFMTRPRSQYRIMAVALGVAFVAVGLAFGLERHFSNWGIVSFLVGVGTALTIGGVFVPGRHLVTFFAICVALNILGALYALFYPHPAY